MEFIKRKGMRRKFWLEVNEDAQGYGLRDNRILNPEESRRENIRRTWNI